MSEAPNLDRVAEVLIRVVLRVVSDNEDTSGGGRDADVGVLPGID